MMRNLKTWAVAATLLAPLPAFAQGYIGPDGTSVRPFYYSVAPGSPGTSSANPLFVSGGGGGGGGSSATPTGTPVSNATAVMGYDGNALASLAGQTSGNQTLTSILNAIATAANQTSEINGLNTINTTMTNGSQKVQIIAQTQVGATSTTTNPTMSSTAGTYVTPTGLAANSARKGCQIYYLAAGAGKLSILLNSSTVPLPALNPGDSFDCGSMPVEQGTIQLASTVASDPNVLVNLQ